jgi:hypothetical protein
MGQLGALPKGVYGEVRGCWDCGRLEERKGICESRVPAKVLRDRMEGISIGMIALRVRTMKLTSSLCLEVNSVH